MSYKVEFEDNMLSIFTRKRFEPELDPTKSRFITVKSDDVGTYVVHNIEGVIGHKQPHGYLWVFRIAELYANDEDLKKIEREIVDRLGLEEDEGWMESALQKSIKYLDDATLVMELRAETQMGIAYCEEAVEECGLDMNKCLAYLKDRKSKLL